MISEQFRNILYYNEHVGNAVLTADNTVEIFTDGKNLYEDLESEIKNASEYIHILSYLVKPDEVLNGLEHLLEEKAAQNVKVRLLMDAVGSRRMKKKDFKRMQRKGIQAAEYFSRKGTLHSRINYRNHRKIIVIDGKAGYVGGFNLAREYLGKNARLGYWRDTHLKIKGSAVHILENCFLEDWKKVSGKTVWKRENDPRKEKDPNTGNSAVQIIAGGPDSRWQNIRNNYVQLFGLARKYIYIQTPYFVPDEITMYALRSAALSGVDVRLMIPCKPDHMFVYWASCAYAAELLEAGVKCYTYENGFLHAKGVIVDGLVCCYGTANMDIRSFRLNFEVNAVIYDEKIAGQMEKIFYEDLKNSSEMTWEKYQSRAWNIRMKEKISRVLSPIL